MKQPPIHFRRCGECDAYNDAAAARCWLCGRVLTSKDEVILADRVADSSTLHQEPFFAVLTFASMALSLLLILGASQSEPAIAAYVAICSGPAFLTTAIRAVGRRVLGKPFTWQSTFATFFITATTILAFFGLLFIGLVIALFVICAQSQYPR